MRRASVPCVLSALCVLFALADAPAQGYKKAPPAVRKILDLPPAPVVALTPKRDALVVAEWRAYPSIEDFSRPYLKLAGLRIEPDSLEPRPTRYYHRVTVRPLDGGKPIQIEGVEGIQLGLPVWAPDGKRFAITGTVDGAVRLFMGTADSGKIVPFGTRLNPSLTDPVRWTPDSKTIVCLEALSPEDRKPKKSPPTPVISETSGKAGPARTYQDLLRNEEDAGAFELATNSIVKLVSAHDGSAHAIGESAPVSALSISPDGKHLLVETVRRPFSYSLPVSFFPHRTEVWGLDGKVIQKVADLPLADRVPIEGVRTGPRTIQWHPGAPATVVWVEALDGGDPRRKVTHRDRLLSQAVPFKGEPREILKTEHRLSSLAFTDKGQVVVSDFEREKKRRRTWLVAGDKLRLLFDRLTEDRYRDPGTPLTRRTLNGQRVIRTHGDDLFLTGEGASPKGSRPFLDRFSLKTLETKRLFQSEANAYEQVVALVKDDGSTFLTRHESRSSPPNWRVRTAGKDDVREITHYKDGAPELQKITRRLVVYKRPDGVLLSFTLYLPPGHKEGTRLPTVVWAYPREFTDPALAGQVSGSQGRYNTIAGPSHLFFLLAGYAVLDGAAMPVVGPSDKANDTFIDQIVASARAAIVKATELGVTDPARVGVGGHSYGAFMTANLLAHSNLFRAGIARSGAYNRTLTPFGFQNERRTLWQAPEVYAKMSPFMHADKIDEPILLIHGADDNNSGTFPMQSERLYQAIKGHGGTARHVVLPHESHGYAARESVEHSLAEMIEWFDKHVKNAPPSKKGK